MAPSTGISKASRYAAFGQIDWTFAEDWTFTLGARYTEDKKKGFDKAWYVGRIPATAIGAAEANLESAITSAAAESCAWRPLQTCRTTRRCMPLLSGPAGADCCSRLPRACWAVTQGLALDVTQAGTGCVGCVRESRMADCARNLEGEWDGVSGTAGLQWQPTDDTNLYLRYARGYKAGGFIASANMAPGVYADPEYLNSYELGWKQTFGGRFQLNTAVFFYDYTDFQAPLSVQLPGAAARCFATQFLNLDAEVKGVEVETVWSPIDPLKLFVNASYRRFGDHARLLLPGHGGPDGAAPGRPAGGPGRRADAGRQLAAELAGDEVHGRCELHLQLRAGRADVRRHVLVQDDLQSSVFSNPIYTRAVERDRGLPPAVERRGESLHDHRLREERVR